MEQLMSGFLKLSFMKKYLFLLIIPFVFACGPSDKEIALQAKLDSIQEQTELKDEALNDFTATLNAVEDNLSMIKEKESIITMSAQEGGQSAVDRINEDVNTIYALMQENQDKVNALEKKLKNSRYHSAKMTKTVNSLKKRIEEQTLEMAKMQRQLAQKNIVIEGLSDDLKRAIAALDTITKHTEKQNVKIEQQTVKINTAYYVVGTKKELIENKIISRKGGALGLGKTSTLNSNLNTDYFTKIDITELKSVPVQSKRAELVSVHPAGSYELVGEKTVESLTILDADKFWSTTKFLVIQVK